MGERSVQGKAQGSGQGRDSGAALIQDRGGGAGLGKMLRPLWDLVDMEGSRAHHCTTSASGTWWIWGGPEGQHATKAWQPGGLRTAGLRLELGTEMKPLSAAMGN